MSGIAGYYDAAPTPTEGPAVDIPTAHEREYCCGCLDRRVPIVTGVFGAATAVAVLTLIIAMSIDLVPPQQLIGNLQVEAQGPFAKCAGFYGAGLVIGFLLTLPLPVLAGVIHFRRLHRSVFNYVTLGLNIAAFFFVFVSVAWTGFEKSGCGYNNDKGSPSSRAGAASLFFLAAGYTCAALLCPWALHCE